MCESPYGNLIQLSNGKLYGMTRWGGSHNSGVIFNFDPSNNSYNKLYDFDSINGAIPYGSLFNASDGKLYGMSRLGGVNNFGVVFSFDPSNNNYIKLHDFDSINGSYPWADFIEIIPTGIENLYTKIGVTEFPNPFNNSISIHIEKPNSLLATFVIKSVLGQVVFSIEESKLSNSYTKSIDLSVVSKGIYLLEVIVDGEKRKENCQRVNLNRN
ncbi:MAG: T9SS type A sorting domain-containing protein [Bacteroidetes bacterium]|nr:T9SS type A sorting domain-containing protein [Bacteroidota bacterium]